MRWYLTSCVMTQLTASDINYIFRQVALGKKRLLSLESQARPGQDISRGSYPSKRSGLASSLASASRVARTVNASSSVGINSPACK